MLTWAAAGDDEVVYESGVHWASLSIAAIEGPLAVGASVWLLAVAQQHLARPPGRFGRALSRSASCSGPKSGNADVSAERVGERSTVVTAGSGVDGAVTGPSAWR